MTARTAAADHGFLAWAATPFRWMGELVQELARYQAASRAMAELNAMSDRDLADIGISRHSIHEFARWAR